VVTDPPYGFVEYQEDNLDQLESGRGGVWRIPPALNGINRAPVPRFTVLTDNEKVEMFTFFERWAKALYPVLVPGAHVCIARRPSWPTCLTPPSSTPGLSFEASLSGSSPPSGAATGPRMPKTNLPT
jgi:hypothetical protein